jgi:hypothetical protein
MDFKTDFVKTGIPGGTTDRMCNSPGPMTKITAVMAIAFAVGACSKEDKSNGPGNTKATVTAGGLEMLSEGAEPKKALRYKVPKGSKTPVEFAMDMDIDAGMQMSMPTLVMLMDIGVDEVAADGKMKLRSTVTNVTARDRPGASVKASTINGQLDMLNGLAMTATLAPDGTIKDANMEGGKTLPEAMKTQMGSMSQNLEQVAIPLPTVPIGVGAKWKAAKTIEQNGMKMTTVNTVEITALDGDKMSFKTTSDITGPDQSIHQGGTTVDMEDIAGGGTGKGTIDLGKLVMNADIDIHYSAKMKAQGESAPLTMKMKMVLTPK